MKKFSILMLGAAALTMAACQKKADDQLAENVQANYDNAADNLDAMADNTANSAESDALSNQADQLKETGDKKADAIDNADAKTPAEANAAAVNAM